MKKQVFFWAFAISYSLIACRRNHSDHIPATNPDSSLFSWWYILIFGVLICIIFKRKKLKKLFHKLFSNCKLLWKNDRQQEDCISSPKEVLELNIRFEGLSKEIKDLKEQVTKLNKETTRLKDLIKQLQCEKEAHEKEKKEWLEENISLGEQIDNLKASQTCKTENDNDETLSVSIKQVSQQTNSPITTLFADSIIDDCFVKIREAPNEDSTFVLHLTGEDSANFSVYKPAYQRVMSNPSFLEGCDRQILGNTMQLEIASEGKAQRIDSNNKWKVTNKLNIIIR